MNAGKDTVTTLLPRNVHKLELTSSALLARHLDRFLFSDKHAKLGACLHQFPVHAKANNPERPDFSITQLMKNELPGRLVALSDYKNSDFEKACIESLAYSTRVDNDCRVSYACLVFPATRDTIKLELHVGLNKRMLVIPIWEVTLSSPEIWNFFRLLYAGVHFLITTPIFAPRGVCTPTSNLSFRECLNSVYQLPRVFFQEGWVYKLFDTDKEFLNIELVTRFLDKYVEQHRLSKDGRFTYLKYRYLEGNHEISTRTHAICILRQLQELHNEGIVHSDIRKVNIVFCGDGNASLIDFDLADNEGTNYPKAYNAQLDERHSSAQAHMPRKKEHDCYSLHFILAEAHLFHTDFLEAVQHCRLQTATEMLEV